MSKNTERIDLNNGYYLIVHSAGVCESPCPLHSPSDHALNSAPLHWRSDRRIFERICSHGIGHPDPDSMAYARAYGSVDDGTHGCDGCCVGVRLDAE